MPPELDPYERYRRAVRLEHLALTVATLPEHIPIDAALAVRAAEGAIAVHEGWYSWTIFGTILTCTGQDDKALQALRTSSQQGDWKGGNDLYWFALARTHARLGQLDQARSCYKRSLATDVSRDSWTNFVDRFRAETEALAGARPQ
jgi:hypothetical protein